MNEPYKRNTRKSLVTVQRKSTLIDIRDIAAVAAEALQGTLHYNKIYNLTGSETLMHYEIAGKFSKALDKPVEHINVSDEELLEVLLGV